MNLLFHFLGFLFHVSCYDNNKTCFDLESKIICYLMPNVSSVDWITAWKTCNKLNATLPVILNEKDKNVLKNYLSQYTSVLKVWSAERYVGSISAWRWLTGHDFIGTGNRAHIKCDHLIVLRIVHLLIF